VFIAKRTKFSESYSVGMFFFVFGIGIVSSFTISASQSYYLSCHLILFFKVFLPYFIFCCLLSDFQGLIYPDQIYHYGLWKLKVIE